MNPIETEAKIRALEVMMFDSGAASVSCAPSPCSVDARDEFQWVRNAVQTIVSYTRNDDHWGGRAYKRWKVGDVSAFEAVELTRPPNEKGQR